jgi:hypothetical protein
VQLLKNFTALYGTRQFAADAHLLKLQRLQNQVLHTTGKFPHCSASFTWLIYKYTSKLCRQQAEVTQNHENESVRDIVQGETRHRK